MREILKDEGVTGLWRGNSTRMVKVAPACAIMIACYEAGKKVFAEVL
jgi:solute carrier family 25 protein 39/40